MWDFLFDALAAWNMIGLLLGGLVFCGIGALFLGDFILWCLKGEQREGMIVAVRATGLSGDDAVMRDSSSMSDNVDQLVAGKAGSRGRVMYRSVISCRGFGGEMLEGETGAASSSIAGRLPGTKVTVYVREDKPGELRGGGFWEPALGMIFAAPGLLLFWIAFAHFEFTVAAFLMLCALVAFAAFKIRRAIKPGHLREGRKAFAARMRQKRHAKRSQGVRLGRAQVLARLRAQDQVMVRWLPFYILVAFALMGGGWYLGEKQAALEGAGARAAGLVAEVEAVYSSSTDGGGYTYYPVVQFQTEDGGPVRFRSRSGSNPSLYRRGEPVTVLYDPSDPRRTAMIDAGWMNWLLPGGIVSVGAMVLFFTLRAWVAIHRRGRRAI